MSTGVECNNITEDDFFRDKTSLALQLLDDLFHFGEHFGAAEFGDDEVVREKRIAEGFWIWGIRGRGRVKEELKGEFGVFL